MRHDGAARVVLRVLFPSTGSLHRFGVSSALGVMPRVNTPVTRTVLTPRFGRAVALGVDRLRAALRLDRVAVFLAAALFRAAFFFADFLLGEAFLRVRFFDAAVAIDDSRSI